MKSRRLTAYSFKSAAGLPQTLYYEYSYPMEAIFAAADLPHTLYHEYSYPIEKKFAAAELPQTMLTLQQLNFPQSFKRLINVPLMPSYRQLN